MTAWILSELSGVLAVLGAAVAGALGLWRLISVRKREAVAADRIKGYSETRKRIDDADISCDADGARDWLRARDPDKP